MAERTYSVQLQSVDPQRTIDAIKAVRCIVSGAGLHEAKAIVDDVKAGADRVVLRDRLSHDEATAFVATLREAGCSADLLVDGVQPLTVEDQEALLRVVRAAGVASAAWREASTMLSHHGEEMARGTLARVHVVAYTEAAQRMAKRARELEESLDALPPHILARLPEEP